MILSFMILSIRFLTLTLQENVRAVPGFGSTFQQMSDAYHQLLDAAIQHLQELKLRGVSFIPVSPESLRALNQPSPQVSARQTSPPPTSARVAQKSPVAARPVETELGLPEKLSPGSTALTADSKIAAFSELRQRASVCVKCPHLAGSRKNVVFGVGDINAQLMFVGEAPGADEDEQGEPFVGAAGRLLTKIIQTMGLARESVYIANILKCRPDTPGQSFGNRKPTPEEMQTCIPFLHEQIDLIQPKTLVALGGTAVEGLLGKTIGITRLRGQWQTYRGIPLMPTYHPAFLLRNQALSEKRRVWEDMLKVMEKIELPISEKQRNFFLK